jgi:hypothetical protein
MMRKTALLSAMIAVATTAVPVAMPEAAIAADTHVYHRTDHRYHYRCRRSKGTTGLLVGAGAGGLGAAALGAGPVGLAAGVIGGGLLGRHVDKRSNAAHNRRNGCR